VESEERKGSTFCFSLPVKSHVIQEINTNVEGELAQS
jgi:hypothetical protein